ncbi:hypothetical protein ABK040_005951 [Willaertia magna]
MKRTLNDFASDLTTNGSEIKQLKTTNKSQNLNWLDANTLSIVTSFLSLNSQLQLRLVSTSFNELLLESSTIIKIIFDFKNYWNNTICKDESLFKLKKENDIYGEITIKPYLQWIFGAQLRCNGIIENQNILTKKNQSFNDNELKLFKDGIVEIMECINGSGVCSGTVGSLSKLKWNLRDKNKSITFIQHFIKGYNSREDQSDYRYVLGFYEDDNDKELDCLIDVLYYRVESVQDLEEVIVNTKLLETIRTKYCNQLETNNLQEFLTFLMKNAKCQQMVNSVMDGITHCYSKLETGRYPFPKVISENIKRGVNEINTFIENVNLKKYEYSALQHVIHLMKSIATNTDAKYVKYGSEAEDYAFIQLPPENVIEQVKKQLKCMSAPHGDTSASFTIIEYCNENKDIGEAIFHLTNTDKLIRVKQVTSVANLYGGSLSQMVLFYKELNSDDPFKCFYVEGDLNQLGDIGEEEEMDEEREDEESVNTKKEAFPTYTAEESVETIKEMFGLDKTVSDKEFVLSLLFVIKIHRIKYCAERGIVIDQDMTSDCMEFFGEYRSL